MFPFPIAKPQGCDIQTFYGTGDPANNVQAFSWAKPRGVSHVYMMLIGAGGCGLSSPNQGGGSGAVTCWYGAAQHVPDSLIIYTGSGGTSSLVGGSNSSVYMRCRTGEILLLTAQGGAEFPGAAMTPNYFCASGFFNSVAGQVGVNSTAQTPSSTTFLSGGGYTYSAVTANYGYSAPATVSYPGFFQLQPIIVGVGGKANGKGGIGCGGGNDAGLGGNGMVLIASW